MKKRLLILLLGFIMLALATLGGAGYWLIRSYLAAQTQDQINRINQAAFSRYTAFASIISESLETLQHELQDKLVRFDHAHPNPANADQATLIRLANQLGVDALYVLDADTRVVATSYSPDLGLRISEQSAPAGRMLGDLLSHGGFHFSPLDISTINGRLNVYAYYVPPGKHYILEASVLLKPYILQRFPPGFAAIVFSRLIQDTGSSQQIPVQVDLLQHRTHSNYSLLDETLTSDQLPPLQNGEIRSITQGNLISYYRAVAPPENSNSNQFVLMTRFDLTGQNRLLNQLTWLILISLLLGLAGSTILFEYFYHRQIGRQLNQVQQELKDLAAGQLDLQGADKIIMGDLGKNIDLLREQLRERELLRQRQFDSLEEQVQVRTQELEAEIMRRRESEASLEEIRLGMEIANRKLIEANHELVRDAETDPLTGCWNRRHFELAVPGEMARAARYQQQVCMLMFDLDHFKQVNDYFGHAMGDRILSELAELVRKQLRQSDLMFRWGGEEFIIIAPGVSLDQGIALAEKLREKVAAYLFPHGQPLTISVGLADHDPAYTLLDWVCLADTALYAAKQAGRNRVEIAAIGRPGPPCHE